MRYYIKNISISQALSIESQLRYATRTARFEWIDEYFPSRRLYVSAQGEAVLKLHPQLQPCESGRVEDTLDRDGISYRRTETAWTDVLADIFLPHHWQDLWDRITAEGIPYPTRTPYSLCAMWGWCGCSCDSDSWRHTVMQAKVLYEEGKYPAEPPVWAARAREFLAASDDLFAVQDKAARYSRQEGSQAIALLNVFGLTPLTPEQRAWNNLLSCWQFGALRKDQSGTRIWSVRHKRTYDGVDFKVEAEDASTALRQMMEKCLELTEQKFVEAVAMAEKLENRCAQLKKALSADVKINTIPPSAELLALLQKGDNDGYVKL